MHEYSIVQSLIDSCEENAQQNDAKKITKVVVKIGVLSGVEPDLLKTAFDTFKDKTICEESEFIMNIQPVLIQCQKCGEKSELKKHEYSCPKCESIEIKILDGEEMFLMQLEME
jgi:hydrogenase nickel incorporation protein HypA/HybF